MCVREDNTAALIDVLQEETVSPAGFVHSSRRVWLEIMALCLDPSLSRGITGLKHHLLTEFRSRKTENSTVSRGSNVQHTVEINQCILSSCTQSCSHFLI